MPVHNGWQPLIDARIAVVLHIGDSQERQRICATVRFFHAVHCPSSCVLPKWVAICHVTSFISRHARISCKEK